MRRAFILSALVLFYGCPIFNPPKPPEPLYDEACQALLDSGATFENKCSTETVKYVHNPTDNPKHCELTPACSEPPQPPEPPIPPTPVVCEPVSFKPADPQCGGGQSDDLIVKATNAIGDRSVPNSWPKEQKEAASDENLRILAEQLRLMGHCAWRDEDRLMVPRSDGKLDEYHAVGYSDAGWTYKGGWLGCHVPLGGTPTPPPDGIDPATLEGRFRMKLQYAGRCEADTTFQVRSLPYCRSKGFDRPWCPLAQEGDPNRTLLEAKVIGKQQFWCNGEKVDGLENPAKVICCGHLKTCTEDLRVCSEADL